MSPIAIPAMGLFNGTPASISDNEVPQTVAIDADPFDFLNFEIFELWIFEAQARRREGDAPASLLFLCYWSPN